MRHIFSRPYHLTAFPTTFSQPPSGPWLCCLIGFLLCRSEPLIAQGRPSVSVNKRTRRQDGCSGSPAVRGPILVSYSYFEKDDVQLANMQFFMAVGMGMSTHFTRPKCTDFVVVINGNACTPCKNLEIYLHKTEKAIQGVREVWASTSTVMLQREANEGMDFGAHNVTLEWVHQIWQHKSYKHYIFINSSVRGPFYPSYMGRHWQWTQAFTGRMQGNVKIVASSLVCLPHIDAGGYGPKVESWAFAADAVAVIILIEAGVFNLRSCKLCEEGVVIMGEYGISETLLSAGYNVATLLSMYPNGVDWSNEMHWHCNNNVHPSRHGTYDGISMHPFETVFVKASWHVGEPQLSHYTRWFLAHAKGIWNTEGTFDESQYRYAISEEAQEPVIKA